MSCLKSLDFVKGFAVDYMHCTLLGVAKLLLNLWTEPSKSHGTEYNLQSAIPIIDDRMKCVKVPVLIRRKPREISNLKHWKGTNNFIKIEII